MEKASDTLLNRCIYGVLGSFIGSLIALSMMLWFWELNWIYAGYAAGAAFIVSFFVGEKAISLLIDLFKTSRVGCNVCYETFSEPIISLLSDLQKGSRHHGKTPEINDSRSRTRAELQTKRILLRNSLEQEAYEEAAILRDEIQALEASLGADASS